MCFKDKKRVSFRALNSVYNQVYVTGGGTKAHIANMLASSSRCFFTQAGQEEKREMETEILCQSDCRGTERV